MSHSYALMPIPKAVFDDVRGRLKEAGYDHAIHDEGKTLDMHGVALIPMYDSVPEYALVPREILGRLIQATVKHATHPEILSSIQELIEELRRS